MQTRFVVEKPERDSSRKEESMALMKTVMTIRILNLLALIVALPALCSAATVNQLTVKAMNRLPL
jgi:hypothetical protein